MKKKKSNEKREFKAMLFDADGTLYDSTMLHFEAYRKTCFELYKFKFTKKVFFEECVLKNKKPPQILQESGISSSFEEFYKMKKIYYYEIAKEKLKIIKGLGTFLEKLKDSTIPCVVVSGSSLNSLIDSLELLHLKNFFKFLISHEDAGTKQKPDPFPYLIATKRLNISPENCLAFEDTSTGLQSAKSAGIFSVGVKNSVNSISDLVNSDLIINDYGALKYKIFNKLVILP